MSLIEKMSNRVYVNLKRIDYKDFKGDQKKMTVKDDYQIIGILTKEIEIQFTRNLVLDIEKGYDLTIVVEFKRFAAEDGIDFNKIMTKEAIEENINDIFDPVTNHVSLVISQITASFNRPPIITSPSFLTRKNQTEN